MVELLFLKDFYLFVLEIFVEYLLSLDFSLGVRDGKGRLFNFLFKFIVCWG